MVDLILRRLFLFTLAAMKAMRFCLFGLVEERAGTSREQAHGGKGGEEGAHDKIPNSGRSFHRS